MSNETPWTPGPWKHESMTPAVGGPNRCCVATVSFAHQSGDVESDRQAYANARLIAAAPEMAALLQSAWDKTPDTWWYARCREVLAKIKGAQ